MPGHLKMVAEHRLFEELNETEFEVFIHESLDANMFIVHIFSHHEKPSR